MGDLKTGDGAGVIDFHLSLHVCELHNVSLTAHILNLFHKNEALLKSRVFHCIFATKGLYLEYYWKVPGPLLKEIL